MYILCPEREEWIYILTKDDAIEWIQISLFLLLFSNFKVSSMLFMEDLIRSQLVIDYEINEKSQQKLPFLRCILLNQCDELM